MRSKHGRRKLQEHCVAGNTRFVELNVSKLLKNLDLEIQSNLHRHRFRMQTDG